jgi:hypothetical protein
MESYADGMENLAHRNPNDSEPFQSKARNIQSTKRSWILVCIALVLE